MGLGGRPFPLQEDTAVQIAEHAYAGFTGRSGRERNLKYAGVWFEKDYRWRDLPLLASAQGGAAER